ncbi:MAG: DUF523 domain-containing protein [Candidatus Eisenbacteria bacterium]|nr:DUF523 domain-containing protein [Candidatus Eisenbacteria bacterium]
MKIVSACLAGVRCRYDGLSKGREEYERLVAGGGAIPLCPEQLGGLPTPRVPLEIVGGDGADVLDGRARVIDAEGNDRTEEMVRGAEEALRIARLVGADEAILKERSPSCGVLSIVRSGAAIRGAGVAAALLIRSGIPVRSDEEGSP